VSRRRTGFKRVPFTTEEKRSRFHQKLRLLRAGCLRYDEGNYDAAKEIAVHLQVLLGEGDGNHQLASFARSHDRRLPSLYSTPGMSQLGCRLAGHNGGGWVKDGKAMFKPEISYFPAFEAARGSIWTAVKFDVWWKDEPVVDIDADNTLTRKDLVDAMASEDGGKHQDEHVNAVYAKLMRHESLSISITLGGETAEPSHGIEYAAIRQIAYEVQRTIQHSFRDVLEEDILYPPPFRPGPKYEPEVIITENPAYLHRLLDELKRKGRGDSDDAKLFEQKLFWNESTGKRS
jgi:hypothetical protein